MKGRDAAFLMFLLLLGTWLRLDVLIANNFVIDADEAIVGLMARHINEGKPIPVFYYGQHYMGSFEALIASLFFWLFGESGMVLKLVPLVFGIGFIALIYALTAELTQGKRAARMAGLLAALPPSALVVWSSMARGGFIELVVIGTLALIYAVRWLKSDSPSFLETSLVWLLLGFGWWVNNQILYFLLVIALFQALRCIRLTTPWSAKGAHGLMAAVSFLVGSVPFWIYNIEHHWASFGLFRRATVEETVEHLRGVVATALPILWGAKRFWQLEDLFVGSSFIAWAVYGLLLVVVIWVRRQALFNLVRGSLSAYPVEILLAFACCSVIVFSASSFGYLVQAPRYLLPLYVGVFPLAAIGLDALWRWKPFVAKGLLALLVAFNISSQYLYGRAIPGEPFVFAGERVSKDHTQLLAWLEERGITWIRTNYWIGYRVAFESNERVKFLLFQEPFTARIEEYRRGVTADQAGQLPLVLVPSQAEIVAPALESLGYSFERHQLDGYVVLSNLKARVDVQGEVDSELLRIESNVNSSTISAAMDGDRDTRWGTAQPQRPGMEVKLILKELTPIAGLVYDLGRWAHDFPRGFSIGLIDAAGQERALLKPESWGAVRYYLQGQPQMRMVFGPALAREVILRQLGRDEVFDWSIAEVELLR